MWKVEEFCKLIDQKQPDFIQILKD
jgi:hypothetical protein